MAGGPPAGLSAYDDGYERTDEIPVREERHSGGWLVLTVLALLALAGVGWVVYQTLGPGDQEEVVMVAVPHVIGDTETDAEDEIETANLVFAEPERVNDPAPEGEVIDQTPAANQQVEEGSDVTVTISSGPNAILIQDVSGDDESSARSILEGAGLTVAEEVREEDDPDFDEGIVIGTDPAIGAEVSPDDPVTLIVASGQTEMPDVEGKDIFEAMGDLTDARLNANVTRETEERSDVEEDTVVSQSIEAGEVVDYDEEITLVVAVAPPETVTTTYTPTETEEPTTDDPTETEDPTTEDPTTEDPTETDEPPTNQPTSVPTLPTDDPTETGDPTDTGPPTEANPEPPGDMHDAPVPTGAPHPV